MIFLWLLLPLLLAWGLVCLPRRSNALPFWQLSSMAAIALLVALAGYTYVGAWQDLVAERYIKIGAQQTERPPQISQRLLTYLKAKTESRPMEVALWYQLGIEQLKARQPQAALRTFEHIAERTKDQGLEQVISRLRAQLEAPVQTQPK